MQKKPKFSFIRIKKYHTMQLNHEEIRRNIQAEIARTEEKIVGYREMSEPVTPDDAIGRVSRMDAIVNGSVVGAALREAEHNLAQLKAMLSRVGEPSFGLCQRCGSPIPLRRLMLMPQSPYCMGCAK